MQDKESYKKSTLAHKAKEEAEAKAMKLEEPYSRTRQQAQVLERCNVVTLQCRSVGTSMRLWRMGGITLMPMTFVPTLGMHFQIGSHNKLWGVPMIASRQVGFVSSMWARH